MLAITADGSRNCSQELCLEVALKRRLLATSSAAGFIDSDWSDWMTPAVTAHMSAHGRWMDIATSPRREVGEPLRCHFTVCDRWHSRPGSQPFFGFGLYPYNGSRYWWLHSWLIDAEGILIDSAHDQDNETRYFGVPWSWALLEAVNVTPGHAFEDILAVGLRRCATSDNALNDLNNATAPIEPHHEPRPHRNP